MNEIVDDESIHVSGAVKSCEHGYSSIDFWMDLTLRNNGLEMSDFMVHPKRTSNMISESYLIINY